MHGTMTEAAKMALHGFACAQRNRRSPSLGARNQERQCGANATRLRWQGANQQGNQSNVGSSRSGGCCLSGGRMNHRTECVSKEGWGSNWQRQQEGK